VNWFRTGKWRFLYLLALAQLVGGPLVLLQFTVFCKMALHETPRVGVAKAAVGVWNLDDFRAVLATAEHPRATGKKSLPPTDDTKLKI
jgi:hypothetical protein